MVVVICFATVGWEVIGVDVAAVRMCSMLRF